MSTDRPRSRHAASPARSGSFDARRAVAGAIRLLAVGLAVIILAGTGYAWTNVRNLTTQVTRIDQLGLGPKSGAPNDGVNGTNQNILLVGLDSRQGATPAELKELSTGQDGGSMATDTMMVLHVPADGSKATVISLPRDSWVSVKGFGKGKLNSAYADGYSGGGGTKGGAKLLISTVEDLTGLTIDHYVAVSLLAFYRISTAIGGVPVCLKAAQNASTDSDAYGSGYSGIDLPAGPSVIEGKQALAFVRQRHGLPRGDLDRIVRQQYFLSHAFNKVASAGTLLNPAALNRLINAVSSSLQVDQGLDLLKLARQVQDLSAGNITFTTLPNTGAQNIDYQGQQVSIVGVDFAAIPDFISRLLGQPTAYDVAKTVKPSTVEVTVVNAVGTTGLAGRNGAALQALGFTVAAPQGADTTQATTITYPRGMEAQAKTLAAAVPGAVPAVSGDVTGVTLTLGSDGVQVPGAGGTTAAPTKTTVPAPPSPATPAAPVKSPALPGCIS